MVTKDFIWRALRFERLRERLDEFQESRILTGESRLTFKLDALTQDIDRINNLRAQNRNHIRQLRSALERVDARDTLSIERRTLADVRRYERMVRQQADDILQIMRSVRKLVHMEYYEILWDLRRPFTAFSTFLDIARTALNELGKNPANDSSSFYSMKRILRLIGGEYRSLLEHVLDFLHEDFKYFSSLGIKLSVALPENNPVDFDEHLASRSKLKQRINGKVGYIISQINLLRGQLGDITSIDEEQQKVVSMLQESFAQFEKQFSGLGQFCIERVDIANHTILDALTIQKNQYERFKSMQIEIREFAAVLERDTAKTKTYWKTAQMMKRLELIEKARDDLEFQLNDLEKEFNAELSTIRKKDISFLRKEMADAKKAERKVVFLQKSLVRSVRPVAAALGLVLSCASIPPQASLQTPVWDKTNAIHAPADMVVQESLEPIDTVSGVAPEPIETGQMKTVPIPHQAASGVARETAKIPDSAVSVSDRAITDPDVMLWRVRERKHAPDGAHRARRIGEIANQLVTKATNLFPNYSEWVVWRPLIMAVVKLIDTDVSTREIIKIAEQISTNDVDIEAFTIRGENKKENGIWYFFPEENPHGGSYLDFVTRGGGGKSIVSSNHQGSGTPENMSLKRYLIMGVDGHSSKDASRGDVLLVIEVDPVHKKVNIVSVERDTRVHIPGRGMDKINHAYAFGGKELQTKAVEEFLGVELDGVSVVNYGTFKKVYSLVTKQVPNLAYESEEDPVRIAQRLADERERHRRGMQLAQGP